MGVGNGLAPITVPDRLNAPTDGFNAPARHLRYVVERGLALFKIKCERSPDPFQMMLWPRDVNGLAVAVDHAAALAAAACSMVMRTPVTALDQLADIARSTVR